MAIHLQDRVIIITGASSAGIGAATAIECAKAGMHVVLNARRADRLAQTAERVRACGVEAVTVVGDVADPSTNAKLIETANERFGGFYAVFANAGYGLEKAVLDCSLDELRRIFEVNFFAAVDLIQQAGRSLREHHQAGHLLMCSSCLSRFTIPYYSAYSATKAAQAHVCSAMRAELKDVGIHVSSVMPITTQTEFFEVTKNHSGMDESEEALPKHASKLFVQRPERVARAVVGCLRRPKPEVWTSFFVRLAAALFTLSPRFGALMLDKQTQHKPDAD